ncbi:MAG TPA: Uma2 family endonuclease [Acetobacteraceae bacterium]|nr:Uma2 family endonuclease [Acetobacteraceae bacterium]
MSSALRKPMTLAQFLAWEERQELRYEFDGFEPVAMTGGTVAHDRITFNLQKILDVRLAGKPCRPLGPNVKIIVDGHARYPDAIVVCRPVPPDATVVDDPVIVFEILSGGTSKTDLIDKNREYRATPSIQRYVILHQTHRAAIVFVRREPDWLSEIVAGDNATLHLTEIGIGVPLDEIYANVGLPDEPGT